jgi:hypothetical protein
LALHRKVTHSLDDGLSRYVSDVFCPVCLVYFHSRVRLLNHIRYKSAVCRTNLILQGPVLTAEEASELDCQCRPGHRELASKGLRPHVALAPCFRGSGSLVLSPLP